MKKKFLKKILADHNKRLEDLEFRLRLLEEKQGLGQLYYVPDDNDPSRFKEVYTGTPWPNFTLIGTDGILIEWVSESVSTAKMMRW